MKRIIALVLAVLMMAAIFVGCGGGDTTPAGDDTAAGDVDPFGGEDNITLKVWAPEAAKTIVESQCQAFIEQYPDKTISIEVVAQGENEAASALLNDPDAAADVLGFPVDQLNRLVNAGVLAPVFDTYLDDVVARNSEFTIDAGTMDGILQAFPETGQNGYALFYDKSVVSDEDAATLEGVLEACRKGGKKFIIDAGNGFYACTFVYTGGLKNVGISEDGVQEFNDYDEAEVVDTLAAFSALLHEYSDIFESNNNAKIASGMAENPPKVAAGVTGDWDAATIEGILGDNYGVAKLPTINVNGTDKQMISMNGCKFLGVNASSAYLDAAQLLADYLTGEECQQQRLEEISWAPSNNNVAESDLVKSNIALTALLDQAQYSVPQVNIADTFWTPMGTLGEAVYKKDNPTDKDYLTEQLNKCIANIKDE